MQNGRTYTLVVRSTCPGEALLHEGCCLRGATGVPYSSVFARVGDGGGAGAGGPAYFSTGQTNDIRLTYSCNAVALLTVALI